MFFRYCSSRLLLIVLVATAATACGPAEPPRDTVHIAVATNFLGPLNSLVADFESSGDYAVVMSAGSTGALYAQIINGAPYDVFLAADREYPARLVREGRAQPGFVYAYGQLVLWSADGRLNTADGAAVLAAGVFSRLAIANPGLAPYGVAAQQTLQNLGVWDTLANKLVLGENIGQTFAMVATGNAELGLVAQSFLAADASRGGSYWLVPPNLYAPIGQEAVLLKRAESNSTAHAFLAYLRQPETQRKLTAMGYGAGN